MKKKKPVSFSNILKAYRKDGLKLERFHEINTIQYGIITTITLKIFMIFYTWTESSEIVILKII